MAWSLNEILAVTWLDSHKLTMEDVQTLTRLRFKTESELRRMIAEDLMLALSSTAREFFSTHHRWMSESAHHLETFQRRGVHWTYPGHMDYPELYLLLETPPLFLTYIGSPFWKTKTLLSVVGTRHPLDESLRWMDQELTPLVRSGISLVSGGARGIDQKAHFICLREGVPTLVHVPSGLGAVYPRDIEKWGEKIIKAGGAIMSEYGYETKMRTFHFHHRNRLIAASAPAVLIVEGRRASGTLVTARLAAANNRTVLVVPGAPWMPTYQGNLELIVSGASPVRDAADILSALSFTPPIAMRDANSEWQ